jgi:signal peptidase I
MQEATTFPVSELPLPEARPLPAAKSRGRSFVQQLTSAATKALVIFAVIQGCVVQGYRVYGSCMEPNLNTGERLLGNKLSLAQGVHRGDVIVFQPPHKKNTAFVKRVIGLPGEVIEIRNSHVYVNDHVLNEPYLHRAWHDDRAPERIPDHMVFVLGDNRDNSNDSRMWGELPLRNIQAKACFRYWPLDRIGWIQ